MGKYLVKERMVVAGDETYRVGDIVDPCHGTTMSVQRKWAVSMTVRWCVTPGHVLARVSVRVRVSCRVVEQSLMCSGDWLARDNSCVAGRRVVQRRREKSRLCSTSGCGEEVRGEHAGRYDDRHGRTGLVERVGKTGL